MTTSSKTEKKEHWSRHPAFLIILGAAVANLAGIMAVIHYAFVTNTLLFVCIWLLSALLTFIAGLTVPLYAVMALFSKETRKRGYWRFLLGMYLSLPSLAIQSWRDLREQSSSILEKE